MVSIPLEWTIKLKGGNEVKTTLEQLNQAFKRGELSREGYNKALARGNIEATKAIGVGRYQNNIMLAQYPNLIRVSRALSTVTSISRTLLTISNALNISNINRNTADVSMLETKKELNAIERELNELSAAGLEGSKRWIELLEEKAIKTAELKEKNQQLIDQDWNGMVTAVEGAIVGVSTVLNLMIKNKTILSALTRAGTLMGGVFSGFFTLASKAGIAVLDWLFPSLTGKKAMLGVGRAGTTMGSIFGLSFIAAMALAGGLAAYYLIPEIEKSFDKYNRKKAEETGQEINAPGSQFVTKDVKEKARIASVQPAWEAVQSFIDLFTKGIPQAFGETDEVVSDQVSIWQPIIDLFTVTIPESLIVMKDGFFNMFNATIGLTNTFGAGLISGVNQIFGELIKSMNKAISSYNKAAKKMGKSTISSLSFTPSAFTNIPLIPAAKGFNGMVNSPTMFLAGEAGSEHVNITPNGQSSGGNTVIINVAGSVITEKKLAYMVDQYQKQNLKSRGFTGFG